MTTDIQNDDCCPYCSNSGAKIYHGGTCPRVKFVEYYPDGSVKKVEFHDTRFTVSGRDPYTLCQ